MTATRGDSSELLFVYREYFLVVYGGDCFMANYNNTEKFNPDARLKVTEAQIDRVQDSRSSIDVVYDALIEKIDYYNSLIRDAEMDIKHWKEMNQQFELLIKEIDKRK